MAIRSGAKMKTIKISFTCFLRDTGDVAKSGEVFLGRGERVAAGRNGTRNHRGVIRACKPTLAHASIRAVIGVS